MGEAIDQAARRHLANAAKIIGVDIVNIAAGKLLGAHRDSVEHLIDTIEKMDGTEDKIEAVPMLLDPPAASHGVDGIVVELDAGANFHVGVRGPQFVNYIEIDSFVVTIVISEGDVG